MPFQVVPGAYRFALFFFCYFAFYGVYSPYLSLYFEHLGFNALQIGVLMAVIQVTRVFGPTLWGWVADSLHTRIAVVRATSTLALLFFPALFFARDFAWMFCAMALINLFTCSQTPLVEAMAVGVTQGHAGHFGRLRLWGSIGFIVTVGAGGYAIEQLGVARFPWLAISLFGLAVASVYQLRDYQAPAPQRIKGRVRQLLAQPAVIWFFLASFFMILAHVGWYVFYSIYLSELGYSKTQVGGMWALGVLAEVVFFFWQGPVFRRFSLQLILLACFALAALRFSIMAWLAHSVVLMMVAQLLHSATFAAHHTASVLRLQTWFGGPLQARGQSLYSSLAYGLSGAIGGVTLGAVWKGYGASAVYGLSAIFALLGALAMRQSFRRSQSLAIAVDESSSA